jgi:hypothetical protein
MRFLTKLFLCLAILLALIPVTPIFADAKSDYEYQYGQYRQNYIEYTLLKKDFLANPTLDNQQKAVLAAKQTISSRELAKANYAEYLLSLISSSNVTYAPINQIIQSLTSAKVYYTSEEQKSQSIVTPADLKTFTADYIANVIEPDRSFRTGDIAYKISQLVNFQVQLKNSLDIILPKLATPLSTPLQTKINDLQTQGNDINTMVDTFTNKLYSDEQIANIDSENYFSDKSETIKKIQTLQLKWIDSLIDIDVNYAHS